MTITIRNPYVIWVVVAAIGVILAIYSVARKHQSIEPQEKLSSFMHFNEAWLVDDTVFLIDGRDTIKRTIKR